MVHILSNFSGRIPMQVGPFHSRKNPGVYHTCSRCTEGNNIESRYRKREKGGGRKCKRCRSLERKGNC